MPTAPWFEQEELWMLKRPVIFNADRMRNTFLEVNRIVKLLNLQKNEQVLDLGCGTGRHCIEMASRGFEVTGIDITTPFLEIAAENTRKQNLSVRYIHQDMRTFCEPSSFDLIINMFTSFGYFENKQDDITVLEQCFSSLRPGGRLMLEMLGKEVIAARFKPRELLEYDGYSVLVENNISDNWSWLQCKWKVIKDNQIQELGYAHRLYAATEIKQLLEQTGFRNVQFYGDLTGNPYDHTARAMLAIAQK